MGARGVWRLTPPRAAGSPSALRLRSHTGSGGERRGDAPDRLLRSGGEEEVHRSIRGPDAGLAVAFACSGSAPSAHRQSARPKGLDRLPDPYAALSLPRRAPPPLGYFAETSHAATGAALSARLLRGHSSRNEAGPRRVIPYGTERRVQQRVCRLLAFRAAALADCARDFLARSARGEERTRQQVECHRVVGRLHSSQARLA